MSRPLVEEGSTGPDVLDAILRLNLSGANPQIIPSESFDASAAAATRAFQAAHGLTVDGQVGPDTWLLLDQLDGGRLITAADASAIRVALDQAQALVGLNDFAGAQALLTPIYANLAVPPEIRASIASYLGWAEHGLGNVDRARALYLEQLAIISLVAGPPLRARDAIQSLRDLALGLPPGPVPSTINRQNLPPNG